MPLSSDQDLEMVWEEAGIKVGKEEVVVQIKTKSELDMHLDVQISKLTLQDGVLADCVVVCEEAAQHRRLGLPPHRRRLKDRGVAGRDHH